MARVALIGCGVIGSVLVDSMVNGQTQEIELVAILDPVASPARLRAEQMLGTQPVETIEALLAMRPEVVFEAAGHQAVARYGRAVLAAGCDLLLMSVGALAQDDLRQGLFEAAQQSGARLMIPSGAIGGLDILRAASVGGRLDEVVLTSTKRPEALAGQPYIVAHQINLKDLEEAITVFDGSAAEACLAFPMSTNVAAAVSLAGLGFHQTRVRVMADPHAGRTTHLLEARGAFGEIRLTLNNIPHPNNPRTSYLACLGAVAAVQNTVGPIRFV